MYLIITLYYLHELEVRHFCSKSKSQGRWLTFSGSRDVKHRLEGTEYGIIFIVENKTALKWKNAVVNVKYHTKKKAATYSYLLKNKLHLEVELLKKYA